MIGLGAAGGNICDEGAKRGFHCAAINFSQKDLDSLAHVKWKLKVNGSEGVGHIRQDAIQLLSEHHEAVLDFIKTHFSDPSHSIIFIPFSTAGGSGSGTAPLIIDLLTNLFPEKIIVALPIMPSYSEASVSQINTLHVFEELKEIDICILPIDNEQVSKTNSGLGKADLFKVSNTTMVDLLAKLVNYTEKQSRNGILDQKDFLNLFNTPGLCSIAEVDVTKLIPNEKIVISEESIADSVHSSLENSIFAPIEYSKIIKAAIIYDGQEEILPYIDQNKIFSRFENEPIDVFEGNYSEKVGSLVTIFTGLSWCTTRLSKIDQLIQSKKSSIEKALGGETQRFKPKSLSMNLTTPKKKTAASISEVLTKYNK